MQPWLDVWAAAAVHTYLALSLKSFDSRAESRSNARRGFSGFRDRSMLGQPGKSWCFIMPSDAWRDFLFFCSAQP